MTVADEPAHELDYESPHADASAAFACNAVILG